MWDLAEFKILLLVFKALNGQTPDYIYEPDSCLRSSSGALQMVLISVSSFKSVIKTY